MDRVVKQAKTQEDALTILGEDCKHEVLRLAELQSDDWHLDRPLFFACREDREVRILCLSFLFLNLVQFLS